MLSRFISSIRLIKSTGLDNFHYDTVALMVSFLTMHRSKFRDSRPIYRMWWTVMSFTSGWLRSTLWEMALNRGLRRERRLGKWCSSCVSIRYSQSASATGSKWEKHRTLHVLCWILRWEYVVGPFCNNVAFFRQAYNIMRTSQAVQNRMYLEWRSLTESEVLHWIYTGVQ